MHGSREPTREQRRALETTAPAWSRAGFAPARPFVLAAVGIAVLAAPPPVAAWGFTAHRMVNRKAIATLPPPLRALFEGNASYLAEHAIDADLWRGAGREGEGPNHYLDLDAFGAPPFAELQGSEAEHLRRHGADAVERGRVPWRVKEVYTGLVAAFRTRDAAGALERAALLGHYVGDAHVPLHAVLNYDGQLSGQDGIHARWESDLVDRFAQQLEPAVVPRPAQTIADPVGFVFQILLTSFRAAPGVLASDAACRGPRDHADTPEDERYDDGYYSKLYSREGGLLVARLSASATAIGSLWRSAWEEAGRPSMDAGFRFPYVRKASRAVLVSLDGSGATILDDAVARGVMPHLARLRSRGATARGSLTALPAKTAPGHAALFTGAWSDRNGITGTWVPAPGVSVLEMTSGFSSTPLTAEPLWAAAARQGLDVTVASATQVFPWSPYLGEKRFGGSYGSRLTMLDAYRNLDVPEAVYGGDDLVLRPAAGWSDPLPVPDRDAREVEFQVAGTRIDGLLYDDPKDPARGLDTLYLTLDKDAKGGITLKARPAGGGEASSWGGLTLTLAGGKAGAYFRLFTLSPDGREILLYRAPLHVIRSSRPRLEAPLFEATGGFVGNGADGTYERGLLGPPLDQGGDGIAEERYLETVALAARQFERLNDFALEQTAWDLLITYLPQPDEALHLWNGHLDRHLAGHDPALARRLQPYADRVLAITDAYLGHLMERVGAGTVLAVGGDHGMVGADRLLRPNVALVGAGLLALGPRGEVDLARTRAIYYPGNAGYVLINRRSRQGGIVGPEEEESVRKAVQVALAGLRDPETGTEVVRDVLDARTWPGEPRLGGPAGGDLYLTLAPGYDLGAGYTGPMVERTKPKGTHFLDPENPDAQASFTIAGPGVAAGVDLGRIRQIDVAPTLAALLGIDAPAQATGRVLTEALREPPRPTASANKGESTRHAPAR